MGLLNLLLLGANLAALVLLCRGEWPERWAAAFIAAAIFAEPLLQGVHVGTWRAGIALVNAALLAGLWTLANRADRWWLILASSLQLLGVLSAFMPLITDDFLTHTGVAVRLLLWSLVSLVLFLGAWEASAAARFARRDPLDDH